MTKQQMIEELAIVLNETPSNLTEATELESLSGWDSTGLLGVIALLDGELGVNIDVDQLRECKKVSDLIALAGNKLE